MNKAIDAIIKKYGTDKTRLMDILIDTQDALGFIHKSATEQIADTLDISSVDVQQTISFYHFFLFLCSH